MSQDPKLHMALQIAQLAMMLASDRPRKATLDALYIPGLTRGMLESPNVLGHAAKLYKKGWGTTISFNGGDGRAFGGTTPGEVWPGKGHYAMELAELGVPKEHLVPTGPGLHTGEEMRELVLTAKLHGWKRIGMVTIPYHYPRAFCFLVEWMEKHGHHVDVFALCPPVTNWYAFIGASQGKGTTTPADAAYDDAAKLLVQIEKGWAAPPNHVLNYLASRAP